MKSESARSTQRNRKVIEKGAGGDTYEYYPLGKYVVMAPGVCGGRPTFKGTRVEVRVVLHLLRCGSNIADILQNYPRVSKAAVEEAIALATQAFQDQYTLKAA